MLSARDSCAARGMIELWHYLVVTKRFHVQLVGQGPAHEIFTQEKVPHCHVDLPPCGGRGENAIEEICESILKNFLPDIVLVGQSTPPGAGIDEVFLFQANCPTLVVQDFGGDFNFTFGKRPNCFLVEDENAAQLNKARFQVDSYIVGSVRHSNYSKVDFRSLRRDGRTALGIKETEKLHALFSQPLMYVPGYLESIGEWASALRSLQVNRIGFRAHPAHAFSEVETMLGIFESNKMHVERLDDLSVPQAVSVCDSIASVLSNSAVDAVYANYYSPVPLAFPIYLLIHVGVRQFLENSYHLNDQSLFRYGLVATPKDADELEESFRFLDMEEHRQKIWQMCKALPTPHLSLCLVEEAIDSILMRRA